MSAPCAFFHHLIDAPSAGCSAHDLDARREVQVLADGHVRVERRRFRQVAGPLLCVDGVREDVESGHRDIAFAGRHVAGDDSHRAGLPGAVRPKESQNFSLFHAETDVIHRGKRAVALREVLDLNHAKLPAFRFFRYQPLNAPLSRLFCGRKRR
jgi:hypothetical protein